MNISADDDELIGEKQREREEWAELHGYVRYRCMYCGRSFSTDGDPRAEHDCQRREEEE